MMMTSPFSSVASPVTCLCLFLLVRGLFANNLALLSGTLRTFQRAACDAQLVALRCPPGTCISVQLAQYGSAAATAQLCAAAAQAGEAGLTAAASEAGLMASNEQQQRGNGGANSSCLWPKALQYSLLQTVVEACQKKRQCKFHTSPKTFGGDPCPGLRKYVEIAYKCRPYEFRSKVACENDVLHLKCNPNSRIAVYSASFGRTEYESVRCPQPQGVREETCLVSYATETVMQICHGKRRCTLSADSSTFGNPCQKESRMYLKVVYTCVPRKVLRPPYEDTQEEDEQSEPEYADMDYDTVDDLFREPDSFSPSPNLAGNLSGLLPQRPSSPPPHHPPKKEDKMKGNDWQSVESSRVESASHDSYRRRLAKDMQSDSESKSSRVESRVINCTVTIYTNSRTRVIGFISEWINTYNFLLQNQEKLYLYLILSVCAGLLSLLSLVIGRLLWQRHVTQRRLAKDGGGATTLPNGFADDISEIDADIDLTAVNSPQITILPAQAHSPSEVVRYGGSDVTAPRSLSRSVNSQYYYG